MTLEIQLENDLDLFEKHIIESPTNDLDKPHANWDNGNALHGLMKLTADNNTNAPQLMSCEYEHWLYLIFKAKQKGVNIHKINNQNQTPLQYLHSVCNDTILIDIVKTIISNDVHVNYS